MKFRLGHHIIFSLFMISIWACEDEQPKITDHTPPTGSLHGWVTDYWSSESIINATVSAGSQSDMTTGQYGAFALHDLPVGPIEVAASASGYDTHVDTVTIHEDVSRELSIRLRASETILPNTSVLLGVIWIDGSSDPIEDVLIECGGVSTRSYWDGLYRLINVPAGTQTFSASAYGYADFNLEIYIKPDTSYWFSFKMIPVDELTLYVTMDTYVYSGQPGDNYGTEKTFSTGKLAVDRFMSGFIKFDLSSVPANISVVSADLYMIDAYNSTVVKPTGTTYVYQILDKDWSEYSLTFNNKPVQLLILDYESVQFEVSNMYSWDVTTCVKSWLNYTHHNYGFQVSTMGIIDGYGGNIAYCPFYSREAGDNFRARLHIVYRKQ